MRNDHPNNKLKVVLWSRFWPYTSDKSTESDQMVRMSD